MSILFHLDNGNRFYYGTLMYTSMSIKTRSNHKTYLKTLRHMSPEDRLLKAFELSEFSKQLFIHGLHKRFPNLEQQEFKKFLFERLEKCHNRNY
jgi:hypothetical protein